QGRVRSCARELAIGFEGSDPSGVPGFLVVEVRCPWDIGRHPLMQPGDRLDMVLWRRPSPGADDIAIIGVAALARLGRTRTRMRRARSHRSRIPRRICRIGPDACHGAPFELLETVTAYPREGDLGPFGREAAGARSGGEPRSARVAAEVLDGHLAPRVQPCPA